MPKNKLRMRFQTLLFIGTVISIYACNAVSPEAIIYPKGGYPYLEKVDSNDKDYYFLPLRGSIPLTDSMTYDNAKYFFKSFDEANLSIKPSEQDIFRLSIEGFAVSATIITLTESTLIVKQQKSGNKASIYPVENAELLTSLEKTHYYFLNKFFPFCKKTYSYHLEQYKDSMIKGYPKLSNPGYYQYLMNKIIVEKAEPFEYVTREISLTASQFKSLVNLINASGYWSLPYRNLSTVSDGFGYSLEVNTKEKYNLVTCSAGKTETDSKNLKQACQQMLEYAQIGNDLKIWSEDREK